PTSYAWTVTPQSSVAALPQYRPATFTVSWSATAGAGSTIAGFDVYVSDNGGTFIRLLAGTTQTSASYTGLDGHTYAFYSIATDKIGNRQLAPVQPQATTLVDVNAPTSTVAALSAFTSTASFTVNWAGQDNPGGSGVASFQVYVSDNGGTYVLF